MGVTRERWNLAAEKELVDNFGKMEAFTEAPVEEIAKVGGQAGVLPMKSVWTIKPGDLYKCRAVICGNFSERDPCEQVYTAQAEISSVMLALRLGMLKGWQIWKMDVKSAFLHAPMPNGMLVVVRPPRDWVKLGFVEAHVCWTCRKAVYGLRVAPRAWGIERDLRLTELRWTVGKKEYKLIQCRMDSQVWKISEDIDGSDLMGLLICYVDDMLLLMEGGSARDGLSAALSGMWKMSTEVQLEVGMKMGFLGLELELKSLSRLLIHQILFIKSILVKHGLDPTSKPLTSVQVPLPGIQDLPPDEKQLKVIQGFCGEYNWLATRTRGDLSYWVSILASAATKHGEWCLSLAKKILRYLLGTIEDKMVINGSGCEQELVARSDAGYGGASTKSQSGVIIAWGGTLVTWRSSRQSSSALSTCEAEVAAAALGFQILEGVRALLEEWRVVILQPILAVDNKSALTIAEQGGSWRTRYFAVRASRITEEALLGRLSLRYCPTSLMLADAFTKLGTAIMLDTLRQAMAGILLPIPDQGQTITQEDPTWWASMLVHSTRESPGRKQQGDAAGDGPGSELIGVNPTAGQIEPCVDQKNSPPVDPPNQDGRHASGRPIVEGRSDTSVAGPDDGPTRKNGAARSKRASLPATREISASTRQTATSRTGAECVRGSCVGVSQYCQAIQGLGRGECVTSDAV